MSIVSKMFSEVDYNAETKTLTLTFANGQKYAYSGFGASAFNDFINADSKGTFFAHNIRNNYACVKM